MTHSSECVQLPYDVESALHLSQRKHETAFKLVENAIIKLWFIQYTLYRVHKVFRYRVLKETNQLKTEIYSIS